jgi:hypothetical protein
MAHQPKRSDARKVSLSPDVVKRSGGFTSEAKGGRSHNVSESRPFRTHGSKTRQK